MTTIVTVGYGDIVAQNSAEMFCCIILMLTGVVSFSFMTGALTTLIASHDSKEARIHEQMNILHQI